jgi:tRNA 2-thiouridine synthesizing protein A
MTDKIIDARGMRCPWPVLRLARAMRHASHGDEIIIVADDPIAPGEIAAFAKERGVAITTISTEIGNGWQITI